MYIGLFISENLVAVMTRLYAIEARFVAVSKKA